MFFWAGLHPEIRAAVRKCEDYLTFDACLKAEVVAKTALRLDVEYNKIFKFILKAQAAEKTRKIKGKGKAHHSFGICCSLQSASKC
jgi:hypothetical protein